MFKKKLSAVVLSLAILFATSSFAASAIAEPSEISSLKIQEVDTVIAVNDNEAELFEEPAHITAYREKGYSILYVKNGVKDGDGSSINSPLEGNTLPVLVENYVKPEYDKNNNKKILFAVVGKLACGWYGNQTALTGYDIVVTSATGTSEDYIYPSGGSTPAARPIMLTGAGNVFTFDNITVKIPHSEGQLNTFTAGNAILKNVSVIKESDTNKFIVTFGNNDTSTYVGGKIEIYGSKVDVLRGSSYMNGNTEYVIGSNASVDKFISMNNGAKIDGNVIVTIDGGTVTTLYTTPANASGVITGDYVTYLNSGTIGTIVKNTTPNENKGVLGRTILIVNDNTADVPANISDLPYLVSFSGEGAVIYDTVTDKLVLTPNEGVKYVRVTNGTTITSYDILNGGEVELASENNIVIDLAKGTTKVEFLEDATVRTKATITYANSKGNAPEAVTGYTGTVITLATLSDIAGFTFDGWTDGENTYEAGAEYTIASDVTLDAVWTEIIPEDVTLTLTVKLAREEGFTPTGNFAKLYIYTDSTKNELVTAITLEDETTEAGVLSVNVTLALGEYYAEIVKNGYLTSKTIVNAEATSVTMGEISLVAGDIKGSIDAECGDGVIDIDDFIRILRGFAENGSDEIKKAVDINEDGLVNVSDIGFIKANFGKVSD